MQGSTSEKKRSFLWPRLALLIVFVLALMVLASSPSLLPSAFAQDAPLTAAAPLPLDDSPGYEPDPEGFLPGEGGYRDASISVTIEMKRAYHTDIMVARIQVADPSQIRTTMAGRYGTTAASFASTMAKRKNAVLALNGDFFSIHTGGYMVRQGKEYRNNLNGSTDILIIDAHGDFVILPKATPESLAEFKGVTINSFCFGPALIMDGKRCTSLEKREAAPQKLAQRICIAQTGPLSYMVVATEGPENPGSEGLTLEQFADFMDTMDCISAYNLDGGSSSNIVLGGQKINALSTKKVRQISDIIYFASAVEPAAQTDSQSADQ